MTNLVKSRFFDDIINDFKLLSSVVLKQVNYTIELFEDNDNADIFQQIYDNERIIDSLDVRLKREMINAIVLYNPRANEFRQMMGFYDMTTDMERMGDQVMNIARMVKGMDMEGEICQHYQKDIRKLLDGAKRMVQQSIESFDSENSDLARTTISDDDAVDKYFHELLRRLRTENAGKALDASQLNDLICIDTIAHSVERIADYATNISEDTLYVTEGLNVKHTVHKPDEAIELTGHLPDEDPNLPESNNNSRGC